MNLEQLDLPFWTKGGELPAAEARIAAAEVKIGRLLPVEFVKALRIQDSGVSTYSAFRRGEYRVPLPMFFSVDELVSAHERRAKWATPKNVLVVASGGHEWLGFEYGGDAGPAVVYQDHDDAPTERVCDSFEEFLDGLVED